MDAKDEGKFDYVRIVTDHDGESHFEDASMPMSLVDFAPPAAPLNFGAMGKVESLSVISGDANWRGETFHPAPARQFMIAIAGRTRVTVSDGEAREFGPGAMVLLEDTHGMGHSSHFVEASVWAVIRLAR